MEGGAASPLVPNEKERDRTWWEVELDGRCIDEDEVGEEEAEIGMGRVREGGEGGRPDMVGL